jgi:hypothetical protein
MGRPVRLREPWKGKGCAMENPLKTGVFNEESFVEGEKSGKGGEACFGGAPVGWGEED